MYGAIYGRLYGCVGGSTSPQGMRPSNFETDARKKILFTSSVSNPFIFDLLGLERNYFANDDFDDF